MKGVIMAGGKGTRLRPLTCSLPKPMVPLLDKPCMEYMIALLRNHGIIDIAVTTQYRPEAIEAYFGDGSRFGVRLRYFEETVPLGTAGSVKNAQSFLDERFIVLSGDALTDVDLTAFVRFHEANRSALTVLLSRVSDPLEFGVVLTEEDGRIKRFLEKPSWEEVCSDTVNTGIYLVEPNVLSRIPAGVEYDFSKQLFPSLLNEGQPIYGCVSEAYWSDIGNARQYVLSQYDMLEGRVKVEIAGQEIRPGVYAADDVRLHPDCAIEGPAYFGQGAEVGERARIGPYAIIGRGSRIGANSRVEQTVLWSDNRLDEHADVCGSIVCSGVRTKPGVRIEEGTVIGSGTFIGGNAVIRAGAKLWPGKRVAAGTRVHDRVIARERDVRSLAVTSRVSGLPDVEMTPELAARFARAFVSRLPEEGRVQLSSSSDPFAGVIKETLACSMQASGMTVCDAGTLPPAAARLAIARRGCAGGIHVQHDVDAAGAPVCILESCDEAGLPIDRPTQKALENALATDDYRRNPSGRVGARIACPDALAVYAAQVNAAFGQLQAPVPTMAPTEADLTRSEGSARAAARRRILPAKRLWICAEPLYARLVSAALEPQGVRCLRLGTPPSPERWSRLLRGSSLGIVLSPAGQLREVWTPPGRRLDQTSLQLVALMSLFHVRPDGGTIGLPAAFPAIADSMAEGLGWRVVRTGHSLRTMQMASVSLPLHPLADGLFAFAVLWRNMAQSGLQPEQMLEMIPPHYWSHRTVPCPLEGRGEAMRRIAERAQRREAEYGDGIKIHAGDAWTLFQPDADESAIQMYVYAPDESQGSRLLDDQMGWFAEPFQTQP